MSQSEYIAMALRAAPRSPVVGSTTAGADGDVSRIWLPAIEGIRGGRDEVLEAGLRYVLGPDADEAEIPRMARRP